MSNLGVGDTDYTGIDPNILIVFGYLIVIGIIWILLSTFRHRGEKD